MNNNVSNNMKYYLVTFNMNWADEFDCHGLSIFEEDELADLETWKSEERSFWFGTNEGWEDEDFSKCFTVKEVTEEEHRVLCTVIPSLDPVKILNRENGDSFTYIGESSFGIIPTINSIREDLEG